MIPLALMMREGNINSLRASWVSSGVAFQARTAGRPGGMTGGRTGAGRGSMAGLGAWREKGLMIMGGMVGGADGGPFGPLLASAGPAGRSIGCMMKCMASPCDKADCQYRQPLAYFKA
jgi:hypothetical protein